MTTYYDTNLQHISEELKRIDLLIQLHVLKIRSKKEDVDGFQGLYVSEEEINAILDDTYPTTDEDPCRQVGLANLQIVQSFYHTTA